VSEAPRDYFDRARTWAAQGLLIAAALLVLGSFLDWVSVERVPDTVPADQASRAEPFNGFDVSDGYVTGGAGIVVAFSAAMLITRAKSSFAWLAFVAAMIAGAISISDFRGIDQVFEDFQGIGKGISPGIGLILTAVGALLGMVSAVAGVAATPRET
jgi:hypothetical protein